MTSCSLAQVAQQAARDRHRRHGHQQAVDDRRRRRGDVAADQPRDRGGHDRRTTATSAARRVPRAVHAGGAHGRHQGRRLQHDRREAAAVRGRQAHLQRDRRDHQHQHDAVRRGLRAHPNRVRRCRGRSCKNAPSFAPPGIDHSSRPLGGLNAVMLARGRARTRVAAPPRPCPLTASQLSVSSHLPIGGVAACDDCARRAVRVRPSGSRAWLQATTEWLPRELESNLLLLTCELVNNSVLHGEASEEDVIEVELRTTPIGLRAQVTDPGLGLRSGRPRARARRARRLGAGAGGAAGGELGRGARRAHARLVRAGRRGGLDRYRQPLAEAHARAVRLGDQLEMVRQRGDDRDAASAEVVLGRPGAARRRSCRSRTPRSRSRRRRSRRSAGRRGSARRRRIRAGPRWPPPRSWRA